MEKTKTNIAICILLAIVMATTSTIIPLSAAISCYIQSGTITAIALSPNQKQLGADAGWTQRCTFYNGTATGGHECVYFAYQNSTYYGGGASKWAYCVKAFDTRYNTWAPQVYMTDSANDGHYCPSIGALPDGRLIYFYGYGTPLYYYLSTGNASTSTNTTALISSWSNRYQISFGTKGSCSYPQPYRWADRLVVFGRTGDANDGNWAYSTYKANTQGVATILGNNTRFKSWCFGWSNGTQKSNAQPYIDSKMTGAPYKCIWSSTINTQAGCFYFTFGTGYNPNNIMSSAVIAINVSSVSGGDIGIDVYGTYGYGASQKLGSITGTSVGWHNITVTNWFGSVTNITGLYCRYFWFNKTTSSTAKINYVELDVTYTGFNQPTSDFIVKPAFPGCIYGQEYKCTDGTILWCGIWNNASYGSNPNKWQNLHFCYSIDEAQTWKLVDGTTLPSSNIPQNGTRIMWRNVSQVTCEMNAIIDENGKPVIMVWERNSTVGLGNAATIFVCQYSATLGSAGTWTYTRAKDATDNDTITGGVGDCYLDPYFNRLAFWDSGNSTDKYVTLYARCTNSTYKFATAYRDTAHFVYEMHSRTVIDAPLYYNTVTLEEWWDVLGRWRSSGTTKATPYMTTTNIYACKFTANYTVRLSNFNAYINATGWVGTSYTKWQAALYKITETYGSACTMTLLSNTSQSDISSQTPGTWINWVTPLSFTNQPLIVAGQSYVIAFRTNKNNTMNYHYVTQTYPKNSSFIYPYSWTDGGAFPTTIDGHLCTFLNQSMVLDAYPSYLSIRGGAHIYANPDPCSIALGDTDTITIDATVGTYFPTLNSVLIKFAPKSPFSTGGPMTYIINYPTQGMSVTTAPAIIQGVYDYSVELYDQINGGGKKLASFDACLIVGNIGIGGTVVPVDKFGLLAPYIGLALTVTIATVASVVYARRACRLCSRHTFHRIKYAGANMIQWSSNLKKICWK